MDDWVFGRMNSLNCPQNMEKHEDNEKKDVVLWFVSVSDLSEHLDVVPQGAV